MVSRVFLKGPPLLLSQLAEACRSLPICSVQALWNWIVAESRSKASTSSSLYTLSLRLLQVLHLRIDMISTRWNLAVGPVIMVAAAFGGVLVATVASELSGPKREKVLEEKLKP